MKFNWLLVVFLVGGISNSFAQQDSIVKAKVEQEPTYQVFSGHIDIYGE